MPTVTLADLTAIMAEHGLSQERLARFLRVGRSTVQRAFATNTVGPKLALAVLTARKETRMKRTTCVTPAMLLEAGYNTYVDYNKRADPGYKMSYQKRVEDENGTLYFININHGHLVIPPDVDFEYIAPYSQFRRGDLTFNVEMLHHHETIEQIEEFFGDMWANMKCDRYDSFG